jgi:organic hydroperoxide reductase OsmC/OhrA
LTPEPLFGAAWAARFNGAVNDIAKASGPADAGIAVTARV